MFYGAIALTVLAYVFYHLFQKVIPSGVNPILSLTVTYLVAAAISIGLLPFFPLEAGFGAELRKVNWASTGLGAAIIGLELGFLLAYRAGWSISLAALVSNTAVALVLLPLGLLLFREQLTPVKIVGIVVALIGLVLVNWK